MIISRFCKYGRIIFLQAVILSAFLGLLAGCGSGEAQPDEPLVPVEAQPYGPLSDILFSIENLMYVNLTIDPEDWDTLRFEAPGLDHYLADDCPSGPRPRPFNWYAAEAEVNGKSFGEIKVRKKGLMGSMYPLKTSLKLKFRKEAVPWGVRRMTLNNSIQDPSFAHECLTYYLFNKAGLAAPRCGLAVVTVNGVKLGVYTHIEEIKPPMLEYRFFDGSGDLFEITMADFLPDMLVMFEVKGDRPADFGQLSNVSASLELDDQQLLDELAKYIELDQFFSYWAMEIITAHWDGYSGNRNNSYIYLNPQTQRFHFIPWGTDGSFEPPRDFFGPFIGGNSSMPWAVYAHGALARRLFSHPQGRQQYEARLRALLDDVWDENELLEMIATLESTITAELTAHQQAETDAALGILKQHIQNHKLRILAELDQGLADWDRAPNPALCVEINQTFSGKLVTSFDSLGEAIMLTGEGEAFETDAAGTRQLQLIRGIIGEVKDVSGNSLIILTSGMGPASNGQAVFFQIMLAAESFVEGNTVLLDFGQARTEAAWVDMSTFAQTPAGFAGNGQLILDKVSTTSGAAVEITFTVPLAVFKR